MGLLVEAGDGYRAQPNVTVLNNRGFSDPPLQRNWETKRNIIGKPLSGQNRLNVLGQDVQV